MDIRVKKSKKSIFDAFVNLRSKKELRKITVKELCEKALINKSTFYTYYEDMFDLSDKIESEVVDGIVSTISNPQMMIDEPVKFYRNLLGAMSENKKLIDTVFSGSQHPNLIVKISKSLKKMTFENHPEYINDKKICTLLDYAIYGGYYAFVENQENTNDYSDELIESISVISEHMTKLIKASIPTLKSNITQKYFLHIFQAVLFINLCKVRFLSNFKIFI